MMKNLRVVSVSAMMAAFAATSAWAAAASACPTEKAGWSVNGAGICLFTISSVKDTTITIPEDLKTFDLVYNGVDDVDDGKSGKINIHCANHNNTVSITPVVVNLNSESSLSIRNRIDVTAFGADEDAAAFLEDYQSETGMFTCNGKKCESSDAVTGLNALSVVFNSKTGKNVNKFAITVRQEQYDFGPMQVYNVKGLEKGKIDDLVENATIIVGLDDKLIPLVASSYGVSVEVLFAVKAAAKPLLPLFSSISAVLGREDEISNMVLLNGSGEYPLYGLTQDIDVGYVYLDRTFVNSKDGSARSTIAFPFDIATDNIQGASEILQFTRIGKDGNNNDAVFMKKVYCAQAGDKCPATNSMLEAYKPYIVVMKSGVTSLEFDGGVTLKATTMEAGYADFADPDSWWVFRGVFEKHTWKEAPANTYGYAASGKDEKGNDLAGKFVKVGAGAYIYPFRGVLTYVSPLKAAPANSSYALRPNVLPDEMNIVVEGDNNETTVIGRFNTRTGEMKFINNLKHTYDLKGRRVNGVNNARGAYYGKKVMR